MDFYFEIYKIIALCISLISKALGANIFIK
jgi:hypothetical protein